jgi:chromosome segregation ATPase
MNVKKAPLLQKIIFTVLALVVGLLVGLGMGQLQVKKAQKAFEDKMKEANKKIAFMQKKMNEEKAESVRSVQQQCQGNLDAIQRLEDEKKALGFQAAKLKEQVRKLETQSRESAETMARTKKEYDETSANLKKEIQGLEQKSRDQEQGLKKAAGEKQSLQADLKKKTQDLGACVSNNAELSILAEELVAAYKNKGLGNVLLQKEPLTQIKRVKLEQLTQQYMEQISQKKINNK